MCVEEEYVEISFIQKAYVISELFFPNVFSLSCSVSLIVIKNLLVASHS